MKLADDLRRIFLSEDLKHQEVGSMGSPTSSEAATEAAERHARAENVVLKAIKNGGAYWP